MIDPAVTGDSIDWRHAAPGPDDRTPPLVTIAVPSLNQGRYLDDALASIFDQRLPVEVFVADGGSTDNTLEVIGRWEGRLRGWYSQPDGGQAAAVNTCIASGGRRLSTG